jgi:proline iminopeptidase
MDSRMRYSTSADNLSEVLLADFTISDTIQGITAPTLILGGRHDWVTPPSQAARMQRALPHATPGDLRGKRPLSLRRRISAVQ